MITEGGSLDRELGRRIQAARGALAKMRPLLAGGRNWRHMRACFASAYCSIVLSVLLYGSDVWALTAAQLERLEVFHRSCLRSALPRRSGYLLVASSELSVFGLPSVAMLLARGQLRWLGHIARMPDFRLPKILLGARLAVPGQGSRGSHAPTLLGTGGQTGRYADLLRRHLTSAARRLHFDGARDPWHVLAGHQAKWRLFVSAIFE